MTTLEFLNALQASSFSKHIGHLNHLFGATLELTHIVGMLLVLSPIVLVSLRLLGVGLNAAPVRELVRATSKLIWTGLALLAISGTLILIPAASTYYPNDFLWDKLTLLVLALTAHLTVFRYVTHSQSPHPLAAKASALLSLGLWFGVAFMGRFIGFF
jgi:hypothetical protein